MRSIGVRGLAAALVLLAGGCNNSTTTATAPAATITEQLSGVVPAPIPGGPVQSSFVTFNSAASGMGFVALTSAIETLANGSLNLAVSVGLQIGTPSGGACVLPSGSTPFFVQAGPAQLTTTIAAGASCILVTSGDQTAQAGQVAYTIAVTHF